VIVGCHAAVVKVLADVLVALVALAHAYFLVLEMFLWTKPLGRRTFGLDRSFAEQTRSLAANQGLYNGFLVAGLIWGLLAGVDLRVPVLTFFLVCVVVAGVFGALTVNRRILFVQALPAVLALAAVLVG
jgi:putative membrane protein